MDSLMAVAAVFGISTVALLIVFIVLATCNVSGRCSENERLIMEDWDDEEE